MLLGAADPGVDVSMLLRRVLSKQRQDAGYAIHPFTARHRDVIDGPPQPQRGRGDAILPAEVGSGLENNFVKVMKRMHHNGSSYEYN